MAPMVAWNPSGFHILTAPPRGLKYNAGYYSTEILERIQNLWKGQGADST
jgi:hypothetical protein